LFLTAAVYSTPVGSALARFEFVQPHMGTRFKIVLYAPDVATAQRASDAAFERIAELDNIMSDYRETSELMALSRQAGGPPVRVSDDLLRILIRSQEVARQTGGAFDVTVGPIVQLWRRARRTGQMPDPERLSEARKRTGYDKLHIEEKTHTVRLDTPGMLPDLGGIAKGYAADQAIAVLKRHSIGQALVAAGGDIAVSNPPPGSSGWVIGIAPLDSPEKPPTRYLSLANAAVSTSGDAEQHVEIEGVRYSHIIDPKTGLGLTGRSSVTVVASDDTTADALATAVSVLGPERGLQVIDATPGAAALFLQASAHGVQIFESKRWKDVPKGAPKGNQLR
jgi:thiamine biosynthesis lipoprotein